MTAQPAVSFETYEGDPVPAGLPQFERLGEGHYRLTSGDQQMVLDVEQLRRERRELVGQLAVHCRLAGVPTIDGKLSDATFNLSNLRDRAERARWLAGRAKTGDLVDWAGLLEEFCQRVLQAEREGNPAIDLRTLPPAPAEPFHEVLGLRLPARHASMLFGDGGTAKTYLGIIVAGELCRRGVRVGYWDWELDEFAIRERLQRLYGRDLPALTYIRCDRPLVFEVDRHKRLVEEHGLQYGIFDSAGYGCAGPPEAAEGATEYGQAFRRLNIGGLHLAHIKAGEGNDQRPFGSVFWHNSARATWFVKRATTIEAAGAITVGLFNRKQNLGPIQPAVGLVLRFSETGTSWKPVPVADIGELAEGLPLWQRIRSIVQRGPQTYAALADELGEKVNSVEKAVRRKSAVFVLVSGQVDGINRVGLAERRFS